MCVWCVHVCVWGGVGVDMYICMDKYVSGSVGERVENTGYRDATT